MLIRREHANIRIQDRASIREDVVAVETQSGLPQVHEVLEDRNIVQDETGPERHAPAPSVEAFTDHHHVSVRRVGIVWKRGEVLDEVAAMYTSNAFAQILWPSPRIEASVGEHGCAERDQGHATPWHGPGDVRGSQRRHRATQTVAGQQNVAAPIPTNALERPQQLGTDGPPAAQEPSMRAPVLLVGRLRGIHGAGQEDGQIAEPVRQPLRPAERYDGVLGPIGQTTVGNHDLHTGPVVTHEQVTRAPPRALVPVNGTRLFDGQFDRTGRSAFAYHALGSERAQTRFGSVRYRRLPRQRSGEATEYSHDPTPSFNSAKDPSRLQMETLDSNRWPYRLSAAVAFIAIARALICTGRRKRDRTRRSRLEPTGWRTKIRLAWWDTMAALPPRDAPLASVVWVASWCATFVLVYAAVSTAILVLGDVAMSAKGLIWLVVAAGRDAASGEMEGGGMPLSIKDALSIPLGVMYRTVIEAYTRTKPGTVSMISAMSSMAPLAPVYVGSVQALSSMSTGPKRIRYHPFDPLVCESKTI